MVFVPYKLHGRLTQEDWYARRAAGKMTEEEIARARAAGLQSWCFNDLRLLHAIGSLDWDGFAGSMMFQHFIDVHGTVAEKIRLEDLKVGYHYRIVW
jgi:hypothetical protein